MKTPKYQTSDQYIQNCPEEVRAKLVELRTAIQAAAPGSAESLERFDLPGFGYKDEGYEYGGMFIWFGYKSPYIRLYVMPEIIDKHKAELTKYKTTKSVINFPVDQELPVSLINKLVKDSLKAIRK